MASLPELLEGQPLLPYIRQAGFSVRDPYKFGARKLLDYLLIFIQEGTFILYVEDKRYELTKGDFCLVQPGETHWFEGTTSTILPFMHLDFFYNPLRTDSFPTRPGQVDLGEYRKLQQPRLNDCDGIHVPVPIMPREKDHFRETMLQTIRMWNKRDILSKLEASKLATELVLGIIRAHGVAGAARTTDQHALDWVPSYMSLHLPEQIQIEELASMAGLSASRFSFLFRREFGMPPHRYLLRMRIDHARELLRNRILTISQISDYCGFGSIHHFTKLFKQITGESPRAYRSKLE
ncbi:MAG: hypothetical protein K0R57_5500 [Paenibacillaceae bacterium]|jgi:AraC-like DNA-binding protein|nr:hypothetical protein [Paenibacillaceae bacterium]